MKKLGYARVSTREQNEKRQIIALNEAGVMQENIYLDKLSGKNFDRPSYKKMLNDVKPGDLIILCSIDRLGRDYSEILEQWQYITKELKANIKVLDMPLLDTSANLQSLDTTFIADLVLQILSYVAQKERESIRARQKAGIEAMQIVNGKRIGKTGRPTGRPKKDLPSNYKYIVGKQKSGTISISEACRQLNISRVTYYKLFASKE